MNPTLQPQTEFAKHLANLLIRAEWVTVEIRDDRSFASDRWLNIGSVSLEPEPPEISKVGDETLATNAVTFGHYTWVVASADEIRQQLKTVVADNLSEDHANRFMHVLTEAIEDLARRLLLLLPCFDADSLAEFPLRKPTTLVLDTSSVLQGALDFASTFLYPIARLKVPAVVPLEILNMANTYFALRRFAGALTIPKRIRCLREHAKSQGGQRALLRLEWHSNAEVERPIQGADPLRVIFRPDQENEFKDLNLSNVERSFADRLVFESAREHQARISPDHPVWILTSDQGLARMALSEGMYALYFEARRAGGLWGRTLTGTLFHPFVSTLYAVPLTKLLWELATVFGAVRLRLPDGVSSATVQAIGEDLSWAPYHAKEDLLWCRIDLPTAAPPKLKTKKEEIKLPRTDRKPQVGAKGGSSNKVNPISANSISVPRLISLIAALSEKTVLTEDEAFAALRITGRGSLKEYRAFLRSGSFLVEGEREIRKADPLDELWKALKTADIRAMRDLFFRFPSFESFINLIRDKGKTADWIKHSLMRPKTLPAYRTLAEISAMALMIPDKGICLTPELPNVGVFVSAALDAYKRLALDDPWVLTGEWLEALSWDTGIHPTVTRQLLESAYDSGEIARYFEGSTPDTRFEEHTVDVIETNGIPKVERYFLYHGDFLRAERSSVRLRLERKI